MPSIWIPPQYMRDKTDEHFKKYGPKETNWCSLTMEVLEGIGAKKVDSDGNLVENGVDFSKKGLKLGHYEKELVKVDGRVLKPGVLKQDLEKYKAFKTCHYYLNNDKSGFPKVYNIYSNKKSSADLWVIGPSKALANHYRQLYDGFVPGEDHPDCDDKDDFRARFDEKYCFPDPNITHTAPSTPTGSRRSNLTAFHANVSQRHLQVGNDSAWTRMAPPPPLGSDTIPTARGGMIEYFGPTPGYIPPYAPGQRGYMIPEKEDKKKAPKQHAATKNYTKVPVVVNVIVILGCSWMAHRPDTTEGMMYFWLFLVAAYLYIIKQQLKKEKED